MILVDLCKKGRKTFFLLIRIVINSIILYIFKRMKRYTNRAFRSSLLNVSLERRSGRGYEFKEARKFANRFQSFSGNIVKIKGFQLACLLFPPVSRIFSARYLRILIREWWMRERKREREKRVDRVGGRRNVIGKKL